MLTTKTTKICNPRKFLALWYTDMSNSCTQAKVQISHAAKGIAI